MTSLWRFLRDKRNQQVLGWLGGGLVVAATGLWVAFIYLFPPLKSPASRGSVTTSGPQSPVITDTRGDVNVNFGAPAQLDRAPRSQQGRAHGGVAHLHGTS